MSQPAADGGSGSAREVLDEAVRTGVIPGAVFAAGAPGTQTQVLVMGQAQVLGGPPRPMYRETLFDLASLTKVVATLPAVLRLAGSGALALDDRVTRFLPGFGGPERDSVTVRQLLAHTAGLPASVRFWTSYPDPAEAGRTLLQVPLSHPPGTRVVYSDVGFMLLGRLVSAVTGSALDVSVAELVTGPLGMTRTGFRPARDGADTEAAETQGADTAETAPAATELRPDGTARTGIVHDENARFFGGVAGHAGLFAPVDDLIAYLRGAWLADGFLTPEIRQEACSPQPPGLAGARGLGWVLRGDPGDSLGRRWPPGSVSHTGFTGTSLAFDPAGGGWAVLLTNEVHFGRGRGVIRQLREAVCDRCAPRQAD